MVCAVMAPTYEVFVYQSVIPYKITGLRLFQERGSRLDTSSARKKAFFINVFAQYRRY